MPARPPPQHTPTRLLNVKASWFFTLYAMLIKCHGPPTSLRGSTTTDVHSHSQLQQVAAADEEEELLNQAIEDVRHQRHRALLIQCVVQRRHFSMVLLTARPRPPAVWSRAPCGLVHKAVALTPTAPGRADSTLTHSGRPTRGGVLQPSAGTRGTMELSAPLDSASDGHRHRGARPPRWCGGECAPRKRRVASRDRPPPPAWLR